MDEALASSDRPLTREEILSRIGVANKLEMDAPHLLLNLSCVSAHLTHLSELGRVEPIVQDCLLVWKRKT